MAQGEEAAKVPLSSSRAIRFASLALMVVTINRLVWRPLYRLAETKYRLSA